MVRGGARIPARDCRRWRGVWGGFREETDEEEGYIYRGVLGGGGESGRGSRAIRDTAAVERARASTWLGVRRKKTAGPTRQWLRARARGSKRPVRRVFGHGSELLGQLGRGERERWPGRLGFSLLKRLFPFFF